MASKPALDAEQKQFLKMRKATLEKTPQEMLDFLRPLAFFDRKVDRLRTASQVGCGVTLIGGIILAFIGLLVPAILAGAGLVGSVVLMRWTGKRDLSNNLREFLLPVLAVLRDDFDKSRKIRLELDLTPPTADEKLVEEGKPYARGAYYKIVDKFYRDPWVKADAVLVDGTRVSWSIVDAIRVRSKTKKNPRGKHKTKTKTRRRCNLRVDVSMKKKEYALEMPNVEDAGKRSAVSLRHQVLTDSTDPIPPKELIDLIASVYRAARPAA